MRENTDQKNSEYRHFSRSDCSTSFIVEPNFEWNFQLLVNDVTKDVVCEGTGYAFGSVHDVFSNFYCQNEQKSTLR